MRRNVLIVLILGLLSTSLTGCIDRLPDDAKATVFSPFNPEDEPTIISAQRVDSTLPEDLEIGAEDIWCVNISYPCWNDDYGRYDICADSRLARLIDDVWQVSVVVEEEDREAWKARGCELVEGKVWQPHVSY